MRALHRFGLPLLLVTAACGDDSTESTTPPEPKLVTIEGDVLAFLTEVPGPRIVGAKVSILEHPEMEVVTGDDAHFRFEGLEAGSEVTLLVEHPDLKTTQTATITLGENGVNPFSIQVVPKGIFTAVEALVPLPVEEESYCVIASTVARLGGSLYVRLRQGMPGVSVTLDPPVDPESGPLYFNEDVIPDAMQESTSIDGGVLFYRVPPGDYTLRASKDDAVFNEVKLQCRAGVIVNGGPPLGFLANVVNPDYGAGAELATGEDTASSDAMCEQTRACVNENAGAIDYPDATLASCKAMFRNVWASIDQGCDPDGELRAAARALYDCRSASCELVLGDDEACVPEEAAVREAESTFGSCLKASE